MLYNREELKRFNTYEQCIEPLKRYLYKFINDRKNIKRLKWHEKDFLFNNMRLLRDENGTKVYDIFNIDEAKYYAFNLLILIYACSDYGIIDFNSETCDYDRAISNDEKAIHKKLFERFIANWSSQLDKGEGVYLMVLKPSYERKKKALEEKLKNTTDLKYQESLLYMKSVFFHIMYKAKMYFDEKPKCEKYEMININGIKVYADIYTYCHVLTRHYYPSMNNGIGGTINDDIPILCIDNLPKSLLALIKCYNDKNPISSTQEYFLFEYSCIKYIMWVKYVIGDSKNDGGMWIRSFYKCEEQGDLQKFNTRRMISVNEHLSIYI